MIDPISLVIGGALVGGGWLAGRVSARRTKSEQQSPAVCGCGHDLALHDREAGHCHAENYRKLGNGLKGWARCNCQRYTGPTPLEEFFAPTPLPPSQ
ncbi:hypothetical protein VMT65_04545 [Nocardia sp. CDC153]|uniref:hypothetical protein n=1 Tax=Nocardia sp. CDC153 TaxID=3112167 RepID=UPI002DC022C3|nr:hypothetical protein [Nocardia sp. CDC153]MEC3952299.1 hypothetical protein [Nocardia sp. CDC153]